MVGDIYHRDAVIVPKINKIYKYHRKDCRFDKRQYYPEKDLHIPRAVYFCRLGKSVRQHTESAVKQLKIQPRN